MQTVVSGWAESDPLGALQFLRQMPKHEVTQYIYSVTYSLARVDGPAALALIDEFKLPHHYASNVYDAWATADPAGAARALLAGSGKIDSLGAWHGVIGHWVRADAAAATAFVEAMPDGHRKQQARQGLLNQLGESDPATALQMSLEQLTGSAKVSASHQIISSWAVRDLPAARAWIEQQPDKSMRNKLYTAISHQWAQTDPASAAAFLSSETGMSSTLSQQMAQTVAHQWAEQDPEAALAWLQKLPTGMVRNQAAQGVLQSFARADPQRAKTLAETLPPDLRNTAYMSIAQNLAQHDLSEALEWIKEMPKGSARRQALNGIAYSEGMRADPQQALALLSDMPSGMERGNFINAIANSWAQQDPAEAFEWAKSLPNKGERQRALSNLSYMMAEHDPKAAAEYFNSLPAAEGQHQFASLARQWASHDLDGARAWVEELPAGEKRNRAAAELASGWAAQNPVEAARYVASLPVGKAQNDAALGVVSEWAGHDPRSAAAWVARFPDAELQSSAADNLMSRWAQADPEGAAGWLAELPAGSVRDRAATTYSNHMFEDPEAAIRAAEFISEGPARLNTLQNAASRWMEQDREAALRWIESANLPPHTKHVLLEHTPREEAVFE